MIKGDDIDVCVRSSTINKQNAAAALHTTTTTTNAAAAVTAVPSIPYDTIVAKYYKVKHKIGSGSFGEIYQGVDLRTNDVIALKMERQDSKYPQLFEEYRVYQSIAAAPGFPRVYWYGSYDRYNVLIMQLLGPSLEMLYNKCNRRFSVKTVALLAIQLISRIEHQHSYNYLHRDVKPDNFLMGRTPHDEAIVHVIDMGLAKVYRDHNGDHIPKKENKKLIGTPRYASINTHLGIEQCRRDDLESIGYMLVYFAIGRLPWQGLKAKTKQEKYDKISAKKKNVPIPDLCASLPHEFTQYLQYVRSLTFEQRPDYKFLRALFQNLLQRNGWKEDHLYDWMTDHSYNNSIINEEYRNTIPPPFPSSSSNHRIVNSHAKPVPSHSSSKALQRTTDYRNTYPNVSSSTSYNALLLTQGFPPQYQQQQQPQQTSTLYHNVDNSISHHQLNAKQSKQRSFTTAPRPLPPASNPSIQPAVAHHQPTNEPSPPPSHLSSPLHSPDALQRSIPPSHNNNIHHYNTNTTNAACSDDLEGVVSSSSSGEVKSAQMDALESMELERDDLRKKCNKYESYLILYRNEILRMRDHIRHYANKPFSFTHPVMGQLFGGMTIQNANTQPFQIHTLARTVTASSNDGTIPSITTTAPCTITNHSIAAALANVSHCSSSRGTSPALASPSVVSAPSVHSPPSSPPPIAAIIPSYLHHHSHSSINASLKRKSPSLFPSPDDHSMKRARHHLLLSDEEDDGAMNNDLQSYHHKEMMDDGIEHQFIDNDA